MEDNFYVSVETFALNRNILKWVEFVVSYITMKTYIVAKSVGFEIPKIVGISLWHSRHSQFKYKK